MAYTCKNRFYLLPAVATAIRGQAPVKRSLHEQYSRRASRKHLAAIMRTSESETNPSLCVRTASAAPANKTDALINFSNGVSGVGKGTLIDLGVWGCYEPWLCFGVACKRADIGCV